jgi:diazepam-binding inhibitor (GABA receptor modulating acyl-CoA-binding protein)
VAVVAANVGLEASLSSSKPQQQQQQHLCAIQQNDDEKNVVVLGGKFQDKKTPPPQTKTDKEETHTPPRATKALFLVTRQMPVTEAEFTQAAEDVKRYKQCTNDEQLELYGWYKQATIGDCTTERPGMFDLKGKAKWDAWKSREGSGKGTAMDEYCKVVAAIKAKYDDDDA